MTNSDSPPIVLHADQEHENLRTVVMLVLISVFFLSYWLINSLLELDFWRDLRDYAVSLSCVLGLVLALAITAGIEACLKRVWHSGRHLTLTENSIRIHDDAANEQVIRLAQGVNHLKWHFNLKGYRRGGREKRVPQNWACLAYQLQQGDTRLIVYSYLSPQKANTWLDDETIKPKFHKIQPGEVYDSSFSARFTSPARPQITNEILTGSDGRYWLAERHRWNEGFELTPHDFAIFMDYLARGKSES